MHNNVCEYEKQIISMKNIATMLVANVNPEVNLFKQRKMAIDGYDLIVMLSRESIADHFVDVLEIINHSSPYLPMHLACKVAVLFLGKNNLIHYTKYQKNKKKYIWMVFIDYTGKPIYPEVNNLVDLEYEGLRFNLLK